MFLVTGLFIYNASVEAEYRLLSSQPVDGAIRSDVLTHLFQTPLHFLANQGQMDEAVIYYARSEGATVYCTQEGLTFGFAGGSISVKFSAEGRVTPQARAELPGKANYLMGSDPASWQMGVPTFAEIVYLAVYPGVDLAYSGDQRRLKYTFNLQPGADPYQIQMIYEDVEGLSVDGATGELVIHTGWCEMRDAAPVAHQQIDGVRKEIDVSFHLVGEKRVGFAIGDYDADYALVIDPTFEIVYSTYLGGSDNDAGYGIALDDDGNTYVTGYTRSDDFPTENPYQGVQGGNGDAFVTKLNSDGSALLWSTYLGGSEGDFGSSIALDGEGNPYITGFTSSDDFPIQNAYQSNFGGMADAFVAKFSSSGALLWSTHLGGSGWDEGKGIVVDGEGSAYVTGFTASGDFPTQNAYQSNRNGANDAFVSKFSSDGDTLLYSTYLGGSENDAAYGIAIDNEGNTYTTGYTASDNFPTENAYQGSSGGSRDAFVTKLSGSGATLVYSTYLGGSEYDAAYGISVSGEGNAYVSGATRSPDFPTQNSYQSDYSGNGDAFVTQLSDGGDALIDSTYLGGSESDEGSCIAVDGQGNAYVAAYTQSDDFLTVSTSSDASQTRGPEDGDSVFMWFDDDDLYMAVLSGSGDDSPSGTGIGPSGWYFGGTGSTGSDDFFTTLNAYQPNPYGGADAFAALYEKTGLEVSSDQLEFGEVAVGNSLEKVVTIKNTGSEPLEISGPAMAGKGIDYLQSFIRRISIPVSVSVPVDC